MKKKVIAKTKGHRADVDPFTIYRILSNRDVEAIGPIVFLDHAPLTKHSPEEPLHKVGKLAHPHRGITTLTYILNGKANHYDSKGHHAC